MSILYITAITASHFFIPRATNRGSYAPNAEAGARFRACRAWLALSTLLHLDIQSCTSDYLVSALKARHVLQFCPQHCHRLVPKLWHAFKSFDPRIQCKSARLSKDKTCLLFNAYNLGGEGRRQKRGYQGDAEYFGISSPDTRKVYMMHVDECFVGEMSLRLASTGKQGKNQYSAGVRWAQDYEI